VCSGKFGMCCMFAGDVVCSESTCPGG
jgi:hypothetical protein